MKWMRNERTWMQHKRNIEGNDCKMKWHEFEMKGHKCNMKETLWKWTQNEKQWKEMKGEDYICWLSTFDQGCFQTHRKLESSQFEYREPTTWNNDKSTKKTITWFGDIENDTFFLQSHMILCFESYEGTRSWNEREWWNWYLSTATGQVEALEYWTMEEYKHQADTRRKRCELWSKELMWWIHKLYRWDGETEEVEPFRFAPWVHALILGCSECFGPKTAELWVKLSNFRAQPLCLVGQWWLENTCCGWVRFQFCSKKNKQHLTWCNVFFVSFLWEENCYIWFVAQLIRLEFESVWIYFSHNLARRPRNSLEGNKPEVRALSDPGRSLIQETGMSRDRDWASN